MCVFTYVVSAPRVFLRSRNLVQGIIGEAHELVCLIALSDTIQSNSVNLTWDFMSSNNRVTVIPTTITTDDSSGIIYTTVIQFAYLTEEDNFNYTCTFTIGDDTEESIFNLTTISEYTLQLIIQHFKHTCK